MRQFPKLLVPILAATLLTCGGKEKESKNATPPDESKPTVIVPPPPKFLEGTPYWVTRSSTWPSIQEWPIGPDGEFTHDSVTLRLSGTVMQDFSMGPKSKDHPIQCWLELTVRPIPRQLIGTAFNIDSVIFYDPVKKRNLRGVPMLSAERSTDVAVVRTSFTNNMVVPYSPDLNENQALNPTVYITAISKKSLKLALPPMNITFFRGAKLESVPIDSLKWGPS